MQRMAVCTNFGNCETADKQEKVPIAQETICPICGQELIPVSDTKLVLFKKVGLVFILVLLIGGGCRVLTQKHLMVRMFIPD